VRTPQRYAPEGLLALNRSAFGMMFDTPAPAEPTQRDGIAVVEVRGPLMHHAGWWFDSYEAIATRVAAALESGPKAIVLSIDSPGGLVPGCFETSAKLRAMTTAAGVPLIAYVDGQATSAAYALACAADRICAPTSARIGSIGVLASLVDASRQAEMFGLKFTLVASGSRKTDGAPEVPTTEEAIAETQRQVNGLAELFFGLVSDARGISVDEVRALEAGIVHGAEAKSLGLIDEVTTLDALLASIASGEAQKGAATSEDNMDEKEDEARKALQAIVDDDDADEKSKARAKKALAAMAEDDEEKEESAEDDKPEPEPEKKDEDAKASLDAAAVKAMIAVELSARDEKAERAQLLASRPDLDEATKDLLASAPIAKVRAAVKNLPRRALKPAAAASATGTRGAGQGDGAADATDPEIAAVDRAMGFTGTASAKVEKRGNVLYLGSAPVIDKETSNG
jgi:signal peptide peptidase SppA